MNAIIANTSNEIEIEKELGARDFSIDFIDSHIIMTALQQQKKWVLLNMKGNFSKEKKNKMIATISSFYWCTRTQ